MDGILYIGHSKLPQGSAARDISQTLALSCILDPYYGVILDVSCTLVTHSAARILEDVLIGKSLRQGLEAAAAELHGRYHGAALTAIEAALKDMHVQWQRAQGAAVER